MKKILLSFVFFAIVNMQAMENINNSSANQLCDVNLIPNEICKQKVAIEHSIDYCFPDNLKFHLNHYASFQAQSICNTNSIENSKAAWINRLEQIEPDTIKQEAEKQKSSSHWSCFWGISKICGAIGLGWLAMKSDATILSTVPLSETTTQLAASGLGLALGGWGVKNLWNAYGQRTKANSGFALAERAIANKEAMHETLAQFDGTVQKANENKR